MLTLATLLLGLGLGIRPFSTDRLLAIYVLVVAAVLAWTFGRTVAESAGEPVDSELEQALARRRVESTRPPELVRVEREIMLGTASAAHLHRRLAPLLRECASLRLAARHGVLLERDPDAARELLGDDAWELLRPDRPAPADPVAPGASLRRVRDAVEAVERL
jgi:hypothetical protein